MPRMPRMPISATAFAALGRRKYMSLKRVVPLLIISRQASFAPQYTASPSRCFSAGQMLSFSHCCKGRSLPSPFSRVMAAWVCMLAKEGKAALPLPSILIALTGIGICVPMPVIILFSIRILVLFSFNSTSSIRMGSIVECCAIVLKSGCRSAALSPLRL